MCSTGAIENIVPQYVPWWDEQVETKVQLIQEVEPGQASAKIEPGQDSAKIEPKLELCQASAKFDPSNLAENVPAATSRPIYDRSAIAPLRSLIGDKAPSPLIKFSLLNLIYAYAYGLKYFSGFEPEKSIEFVQMCFDISGNLNNGQNFDSADMAVESAASAANQVQIKKIVSNSQLINFVSKYFKLHTEMGLLNTGMVARYKPSKVARWLVLTS